MRVAVLGAGNGGIASAFDFAQHGHEVALYAPPEFGANVVAVEQAGGITATGDLQGFAAIRYAGHDVAEAMDDAELVVLVGPAYSTEPLAAAAKPHLTDGMGVLVCPGSCAGAIAFKRTVGLELDDQRCIVGETSTLPYAVRVTDPGVVNVFLKLTAGLLERTRGDFLFYEEGVTESVGRLIEAVDGERLGIARALGVTIMSEPELGARQGYMREENYSTGYSTAPGFRGIRAQARLDHRYLTEDVGYGLVFLTDLAARLGVPAPVMNAVVAIASVVLARDFRAEGRRTLTTLGLNGLSREELAAL